MIDHRTFAIVEPQSHRPVLPAQFITVDSERDAVGLADLERLEVGALLCAAYLRIVFAIDLWQTVVMMIFDLEHLEGVHVDDDLETGNQVRIRITLRRFPHPQVAPTEPSVAPLLRHHRRAVGPDVEEHQ